MRWRDESGQVMVLGVGLTLVVFAVAGLAVDGTRAFLMRRSLQNVADSAAVSGAASIDKRAYYNSGGRVVRLDQAAAHEAAAHLIQERGLPLIVDHMVADDTVSVAVRAEAPTTFLRLVGVDGIEVAASGTAAPFPQIPATAP